MSKIDHSIDPSNAVLQSLQLPEFLMKSLKVDVLRLDTIYPVVSGNKWFKLKYYLQEAQEKHVDTIITFGGAWSNHIIATAYFSRLYGFRAIGIIRGERPTKLSQTLLDAQEYGMVLEFISRDLYSRKNIDGLNKIFEEGFGELYFIPEGGAGFPGIRGSKEILDLVEISGYTHIMCCIGTGTMYAGLITSALPHQEVIGVQVLKGMESAPKQIMGIGHERAKGKIMYNYHFGGYAKKTNELIQFINNFYSRTGIPTDFVYTGKLLFAFSDLVSKNYFPTGSSILIIHSGGLQGNASLPEGTLLF